MLEELGDKKEYDQNVFYEILKEYIKIFLKGQGTWRHHATFQSS